VSVAEGFGRLGVVTDGGGVAAEFGLGEDKANFHKVLLLMFLTQGRKGAKMQGFNKKFNFCEKLL
jgi:hypothetical protein